MTNQLTQSEIQQLLHFLREDLDITSFHKSMHKEDAADFWQDCDKENPNDPVVARAFRNFSDSNRVLRFYTKREKSLVNLITKLKGIK
jgi:16S rRNA G527 N7-methylase RsmG